MLRRTCMLFALFIFLGCSYEDKGDNPDRQSESATKRSGVAIGHPVPSFRVKLADGEGFVSNETLLGQFYLMDFWAVWCSPCILEMPVLHRAFEKFKDDNFTILSLSMDYSWATVEKFRQDWEMPWLHTFLEGGFGNPIANRFEVVGIPSPILVGPDGKVLAMGVELRGDNLEKTLSNYLQVAE